MKQIVKVDSSGIGGWGMVPTIDGDLATAQSPNAKNPSVTLRHQSDNSSAQQTRIAATIGVIPPLSACTDTEGKLSQGLYLWLSKLPGVIPGTGADAFYIFDQHVASTTWVITHTLNKYPSVAVVDSSGNIVTGSISYQSLSQLTVVFNASFTGKAYLN